MRATTFSEFLRFYRRRAALTQENLAARAGLGVRTLSDLERGRVHTPQAQTVDLLVTGLGLDGAEAQEFVALARSSEAVRPRPERTDCAPPPAEPLFGRAAEQQQLAECICRAAASSVLDVVVVHGPPGVGKTSLAVDAAHRFAGRFTDGCLHLDLRGMDTSPLSAERAIARLLRAFGVPDAKMPSDPSDGLRLYRSMLRERTVLLVLDNAANEAQVRPLLAASPGSLVVVTSRNVLAGLNSRSRVDLGPLRHDGAVALLAATAGADRIAADPESADRVAALCGGVPLALAIAGRTTSSLRHLAEQLSDERARLDVLATGDVQVRTAFELSYRLLAPETATLFRRLALIPGPDTSVALAAVAAGIDDAETVLEELVDASLLRPDVPGRYSFHDLIRDYARERLHIDETDVETHRLRTRDWLLTTATRYASAFLPGQGASDLVSAGRWLSDELANWRGAFREAVADGAHEQVLALATSMHWYSDHRGTGGLWLEIYTAGVAAAGELGERERQAQQLNFVCWVYVARHTNIPLALRWHEEALRVARTRGIDLGAVLGRRGRRIAPEVGDHLTTFAECFHGGRNEAFWLGYTPRTTLHDIDLCGAYTTALAHLRELSWSNAFVTRDLNALTGIDEGVGFARVRFLFPPGTRFPSLPVRAGQYGLIFPLEGEAWCTSFELAVALDQGAELDVEHAVFVPWRSDVRPFAEFTQAIKELRDAHPKGSLMERLAKEMGNSVYGKVAQQVAGWRPSGGGRRVFDSRAGEMRDMPPSSISCAPIAAAVTGLVRAILGEILALLPAEHEAFSATTDGLLTTCPPEALRFGRVSRLFATARALVAGSSEDIVEVKHRVGRALIWKTRGAISTEPADPTQPGKPVIARAGHRLDPRPEDPWQETREWERLYRQREWDSRRRQRVFVSLREQHAQDLDLVDVERSVRVNLEFDMKRRLVQVRDVDGLLAAGTEPWRTIEEFLEARETFDLWRRSRRRVLKTTADHADFLRWSEMQPVKRQVGSRGDRPALLVLFLRAWARRALGLPGGRYATLAEAMTAAGHPTTIDAIKKARTRGELAEHRLDELSAADEAFLRWALTRWPSFEIERLVVPASPAAVAVMELRAAAAVPVPLLLPGISASGTATRSGSPAQAAPAE